jgi:hypothetical protein
MVNTLGEDYLILAVNADDDTDYSEYDEDYDPYISEYVQVYINERDSLTGETITVEDFYHQMVVGNELLGVVVAFLILSMIWSLLTFFYKLITRNITNYY